MKKTYLAIICAVVALVAVLWIVGVVTDVFANPAFKAFWFLSHTDAYAATFFAPAFIGAAIILGEYFWFNRHENEPVKLKPDEEQKSK